MSFVAEGSAGRSSGGLSDILVDNVVLVTNLTARCTRRTLDFEHKTFTETRR